jgi:hypothetical protein
MQDRYSSVAGEEVRDGLAKVISMVDHLSDERRKSGDPATAATS